MSQSRQRSELGPIIVKTLIISGLLLLAAQAGSAQTYTPHLDLQYVADGSVSHRLDLYTPDNQTAPVSLIVWIHGGGWQGGDKALGPNSHPLRYARNGYAVASLNYRLSGEAIFPAQIYDCKAAIRWLRANAAQYNLDVTRIGVWGSSAGGHLAALVATSNDVTDLEGTVGGNVQQSSRVQAAVDWYGPTDFLQMDTQTQAQGCGAGGHNAATSPESSLVGCPIQTCPAAVQRANPMTYLTRDDPPFFIQHGTADCTVPTAQSQIFQNLQQNSAHDSSLVLITGEGHGGPLFVTEANLQLVDAFWNAKLKQTVNPLITSARVFVKDSETDHFRNGALGTNYRILISGANLTADTKVLINGSPRGAPYRSDDELMVYGLIGRIPSSGQVEIQVYNAAGRYSNIVRIDVHP